MNASKFIEVLKNSGITSKTAELIMRQIVNSGEEREIRRVKNILEGISLQSQKNGFSDAEEATRLLIKYKLI